MRKSFSTEIECEKSMEKSQVFYFLPINEETKKEEIERLLRSMTFHHVNKQQSLISTSS
jgi:hypothetical protein